jgi:hypothetical protein
MTKSWLLSVLGFLAPVALPLFGHLHEWEPSPYDPHSHYEPTPIPERVILTWEGDPATTQSVTWRTDTSSKKGGR